MGVKVLILSLIILVNLINCEHYELLKVLVLSRHNIRTPISYNFNEITPRKWPEWSEEEGYLTEKGKTMEGYMGEYFHQWLTELKILSFGCPKEEEVFIYANTKQRTLASANAFTNEAFPYCNVTVHHHNNASTDTMDPIFNPILHNTTKSFEDAIIQEMATHLRTLNLTDPYLELQDILDLKNSLLCKNKQFCDLTHEVNTPVIKNQKVKVNGPIRIGNSAVDAFTMEYYQGLPMQNVAWGKITKKSQWATLLEINRAYHNVLFNNTVGANDIARPLLKLMAELLFDKPNPKFILLMGHDANMYTVLKSLEFKPYKLEYQLEKTPIGGKLVFQKWQCVTSGKIFLRVNYVYQSLKQLRKGLKLSLSSPPQSHLLELKGCEMNQHGFCAWNIFETIMHRLTSDVDAEELKNTFLFNG